MKGKQKWVGKIVIVRATMSRWMSQRKWHG